MEFHINCQRSDGRLSVCKSCSSNNTKELARAEGYLNSDLINKGFKKCSVCKEAKKIKCFGKNASKHNGLTSECLICRRERDRLRRANDDIYRLLSNARSATKRFVKTKSGNSFDLIGCTPEQLIKYLESKFQPGMSWRNHGKYGWHIDHIRPLASFINIAEDPEVQSKAFHFTNLQPLWAKDNLRKHAKYEQDT